MVKKKPEYNLWLEQEVHGQRHKLPGNLRQRIKREIEQLTNDPRPSHSKELDTQDLMIPPDIEARRVRIENWRIVYAVNDSAAWVWVLALRKRPPYDYQDLPEILSKLSA